jgi:hypothetical protein
MCSSACGISKLYPDDFPPLPVNDPGVFTNKSACLLDRLQGLGAQVHAGIHGRLW